MNDLEQAQPPDPEGERTFPRDEVEQIANATAQSAVADFARRVTNQRRDMFAAAALTGLAEELMAERDSFVATRCWSLADAMLEADDPGRRIQSMFREQMEVPEPEEAP